MGNNDARIDKFIIQLFKNNDERAVPILYDTYIDLMYHTALDILENEPSADEVIQELLINIWQKRNTLKLKIPLKSYLIKAVTNRCLNYIRDEQSRSNTTGLNEELLEKLSITSQMESYFEADELKILIRNTKRLLPPRTKATFILSRSFKLSHQEIADYLGISKKGVEKHISKALTIYRKLLNQYLKTLLVLNL